MSYQHLSLGPAKNYLFIVLLAFGLSSCQEKKEGSTSTSTVAPTGSDTVDVSAIKQFPILKITKQAFKAAFFDGTEPRDFKKVLWNFKIDDYANVPRSITLVGIAADEDDVPVPGRSVTLGFETDNGENRLYEPINTANLLYNTNELSETDILSLVMNEEEWKEFTHLVFIPHIDPPQNGKRYLRYRVQRRPLPPEPLAQEDEIFTNPCPPNQPNHQN